MCHRFVIVSAIAVWLASGVVSSSARASSDDTSAEPRTQEFWFEGTDISTFWKEEMAVQGGTSIDVGDLPEGDVPIASVFSADGQKIVVAHLKTKNLVVFDANTRAVLDVFALSSAPVDLALTPDGSTAITANFLDDTISLVDLANGNETVVAVGDQPGVVCVTPDGTLAAVGNTVDGTISVIDIANAIELRQISGAGFSSRVSLAFESGVVAVVFSRIEALDNTRVIAPDPINDQVDFFDLGAGTVNSVSTPADPFGIALSGSGIAVLSHLGSADQISVVDTNIEALVKSIPLGQGAFGAITVNPAGTKAVVAVSNAAVVVNLVTDVVSPNLNTASINRLETTADGLYAIAIAFRGSLIEYSSESVVNELNNIFSGYYGDVDPSGPRAVIGGNLTGGESLLVVNTDGAAGFIEANIPSGPPPEADIPRIAAIDPRGNRAITSNNLSQNVSFIDLNSMSVQAIVNVGIRPAELAWTPDGTKALCLSLDSTTLSVIDTSTYAVTGVNLSRRQSQVEISPDGQYAYVAVVASGDGVWRVNLNTLSVDGPKLSTGDMGGIFFLFSQSSGLTLSHDGKTLVTCNTYSDSVSIIDTVSWSVVATVPVGDFPVRAIFNRNDSRIFVSNGRGDTVSVIANAGSSSSVTDTITVGDTPFEMALSSDEITLFVAHAGDDDIGVVNVPLGSLGSRIALPETPQGIAMNVDRSALYVASGGFSVTIGPGPRVSFAQSGYFSTIDPVSRQVVAEVDTGQPPGMLALNECGTRAVIPTPLNDGLRFFELDPPNDFTLSVSPLEVDAADTIRLTTCAGPTGNQVLLAAVAAGGVPFFSPIALGTFGADRSFVLIGTVPPGTPSIDVDFQSFGISFNGFAASNRVTVSF